MNGDQNIYSYSKHNPINLFDPNGLKCVVAMKLPVGFDTDVTTDWNDFGKWRLHSAFTEGGAGPVFWLNATCICKRKRFGTQTTQIKVRFYILEMCYGRCGMSKRESYRWEPFGELEDSVSDTETKILNGGYYMNDASANIGCAKKCKALNN